MFKLLNWRSDNILTSPGLWTYEVYLLILNVVVNLLIILILDSSSEFMGRFVLGFNGSKMGLFVLGFGTDDRHYELRVRPNYLRSESMDAISAL